MNYCSIEDAWKSSDYLTDQFSFYKKKLIENFEIPEEKVQDINNKNMNANTNNNYTNANANTNNKNKNMNNNTDNKNMHENHEAFTNSNHYLDNVLICDDFWDHLNNCSSCRNKMRTRFSSNVMNKVENIVGDNKDTILIFLICLFALIFCNLLVSIINR
jgi:hypothetical protein